MAGGIFTDRPFEPNPKCIVFALGIMGIYWFAPAKKNKWLLPPLFVASYVAMAWYDYAYDCEPKMKSGTSPVGAAMADSIFKPQYRDASAKESRQENLYRRNVYLFHLAFVAPLLLYVGFAPSSAKTKQWLPVVGSLGIGALLYHGYRLARPRRGC